MYHATMMERHAAMIHIVTHPNEDSVKYGTTAPSSGLGDRDNVVYVYKTLPPNNIATIYRKKFCHPPSSITPKAAWGPTATAGRLSESGTKTRPLLTDSTNSAITFFSSFVKLFSI